MTPTKTSFVINQSLTTTVVSRHREKNDKQKLLYTLPTINNTDLGQRELYNNAQPDSDSVIKLVTMIQVKVNLPSGKCVSRC